MHKYLLRILTVSILFICACSNNQDKYVGRWSMKEPYPYRGISNINIKKVDDNLVVFFDERPFVGVYKDGKIVIDRGSGNKQGLVYDSETDRLIVERRGEYNRQ